MSKNILVISASLRNGSNSDRLADEFMRGALESGNNVYLRGFGSFIIKRRAEKTGRNISKNTTIKIPAHNIPAFKPSKVFVDVVKESVAAK